MPLQKTMNANEQAIKKIALIGTLIAIITINMLFIIYHHAEIWQAYHGIITGILCTISFIGFIPLLILNFPSSERIDFMPIIIIVLDIVVTNSIFSNEFSPLPYETWSYHSFLYWFTNFFFVSVGWVYLWFIKSIH